MAYPAWTEWKIEYLLLRTVYIYAKFQIDAASLFTYVYVVYTLMLV